MWDRKIIKAWAKQDLAGGRYRKALIVTWVIGIIGGMIPFLFQYAFQIQFANRYYAYVAFPATWEEFIPNRCAQPVYRGGKLLGALWPFWWAGGFKSVLCAENFSDWTGYLLSPADAGKRPLPGRICWVCTRLYPAGGCYGGNSADCCIEEHTLCGAWCGKVPGI